MEKKYIYNKTTGTLHIEGYCHHGKIINKDPRYAIFKTEDEALAYDGRAVRMCKICQKQREKNLKEI